MAAKVKYMKGAWHVVTHHDGRRRVRRLGPAQADRRDAEKVALKINAALALGQYRVEEPKKKALPFETFAQDWLRREIFLPLEREMDGHVAAGTASSYEMLVRVHLVPFLRQKDVREIGVADVQAFHDHCVDTGKPRSARSIELALVTLRLILSHARAQELVQVNAVEAWKRARGRRRRVSAKGVDTQQVLTFEEVQEFLRVAQADWPEFYPLILFLVDTGARFGEATGLRWIDVDLEHRSARICRSFSSGERIGPTKTGRQRDVELSTRLCQALARVRPDIFPDDALVFPNEAGGFINPQNFRSRVWKRLVRKALGQGRTPTPHALRHTFASLHMARGTNLKWLQAQGGWASAKMLLDVYGHHLPVETRGFSDVLATAPDGTIRHQAQDTPIGAKERSPETSA